MNEIATTAVRGHVIAAALNGEERLLGSAVAEATTFPMAACVEILHEMVGKGELEDVFTLLAPRCGRTLGVFNRLEDLPLGELRRCLCLKCRLRPSFTVTSAEVMVSYRPTRDFLLFLNRQRHALKLASAA